MDKSLLLAYLDARRRPVSDDPKAGERHRALFAQAPGLYLDLLADRAAHISQRREVLRNLTSQPMTVRAGREAILERLAAQPVDEALSLLDALRWTHRNGRFARSLGLSFLLGHERFAELAATRRTRLVKLLRHLLDERTWSSVVRCVRTGAVNAQARPKRPRLLPAAILEQLRIRVTRDARKVADPEAFLRRAVLRYAGDPAAAREALRVLAGDDFAPADPWLATRMTARRDLERGASLPRDTLFGLRGTFHPRVPAARVRYLSTAAAAQGPSLRGGPLTAVFRRSLAGGDCDLYRRLRKLSTGGYGDCGRWLATAGPGAAHFSGDPALRRGEDLSRRTLGAGIVVLAIERKTNLGELLARLSLANAPADLPGEVIRRVQRLLVGSFRS